MWRLYAYIHTHIIHPHVCIHDFRRFPLWRPAPRVRAIYFGRVWDAPPDFRVLWICRQRRISRNLSKLSQSGSKYPSMEIVRSQMLGSIAVLNCCCGLIAGYWSTWTCRRSFHISPACCRYCATADSRDPISHSGSICFISVDSGSKNLAKGNQ